MRAAVLHECPVGSTSPISRWERSGPTKCSCRRAAAGLCHSDLHCIEGTLPIGVPTVLGHESAGVVEAVGSDVTDFRPGDEVIACTSAACGLCPTCITGRPNMCQNRPARAAALGPALAENGVPVDQFAGLGGFAEQMLLPEQALLKMDDSVPVEVAALDRLRGHHRARRGVQHREDSARCDGRDHRVRRDRSERRAGRGGRRCRPRHRGRRDRREARPRAHVRRDRHRRRVVRRSGGAGAGAHARWRRVLVRGPRPESHERAGVRDVGARRYGHDHRLVSVRHDVRASGARLHDGEEDPGLA